MDTFYVIAADWDLGTRMFERQGKDEARVRAAFVKEYPDLKILAVAQRDYE